MKTIRHFLLLIILIGSTMRLQAEPKAIDTDWMVSPLAAMLTNKAEVYCLGWNKEGFCAFFQTIDGGLRGGYAIRFLIFNAVEDKILFDTKVWVDEVKPSSDKASDIAEALAHSEPGMDFGYTCNAQGIDQPKGSGTLKTFPFRYKGKEVSLNIETLEKNNKDTRLVPGLKQLYYKIIVSVKGLGKKSIQQNNGIMFDIQPEGYFLNPYNAQILVVYKIITSGFESDRNTMYGYTGCQLETGFK